MYFWMLKPYSISVFFYDPQFSQNLTNNYKFQTGNNYSNREIQIINSEAKQKNSFNEFFAPPVLWVLQI